MPEAGEGMEEPAAAAVTAYYDSLSAEELREEAAWGELGEAGLAAE